MNILIVSNSDFGLIKFRKELIEALVKKGNDVYVLTPIKENKFQLQELGIKGLIEYPIKRRSIGLINNIKTYQRFKREVVVLNPDVVLTFTIKPNLFIGLLNRKNSFTHMVNITGLGQPLMRSKINAFGYRALYKYALRNTYIVFFQNKSHQKYFKKYNLIKGSFNILPGSGVNLQEFPVNKYPNENGKIRIAFIGRIMDDKGIILYLRLAEIVSKEYPHVDFHVYGEMEENFQAIIESNVKKGFIQYHGQVDRMQSVYAGINAVIHPSHHEGMSNVLLECSSSGRPAIASKIPGCEEIIDHNETGYLFEKDSLKDLLLNMKTFLKLTHEEQKQMGLNARKKVEKTFDRAIVTQIYETAIYNI